MGEHDKQAPSTYDAIALKLNGPEYMAHREAAGKSFLKGDVLGFVEESFKGQAASATYAMNAVIDEVKALATPASGAGKDSLKR